MKYKNVMLIGADGQLGSEWMKWLKRQKVSVSASTFESLDITNTEKLEQAVRDAAPDLIINCSAYTAVDAAEDDFETAMSVNHAAVDHLARLAAEGGAMLVHYSTDYVFSGSEADMVRYPSGFDEGHTPQPANAYARSKYAGERAIRNAGCDHLIVRLSWLCGAGGRNFVKTILQLAAGRDEIAVVNDQFGSPTYAANAVHNTAALLEAGERGLWHVTSRGIITWYDFAAEIVKQAGLAARVVPIPTSGYPTRAFRPFYTKLNTRALEDVKGARLIGWSEGLRELLAEIGHGIPQPKS